MKKRMSVPEVMSFENETTAEAISHCQRIASNGVVTELRKFLLG